MGKIFPLTPTPLAERFLFTLLSATRLKDFQENSFPGGPPVKRARPLWLKVDVAIAAIQLARAFEKQPEALKAPTLLLITSKEEEAREAVHFVYDHCVLKQSACKVLKSVRAYMPGYDSGEFAHFIEVPTSDKLTPFAALCMTETFRLCLDAGVRAIILADSPAGLQSDVTEGVDFVLPLEPLGAADLGLAVQWVTGEKPSDAVDPDIAVAATGADLRLALHPARGAGLSIKRLDQLVRKRRASQKQDSQPGLEEFRGYGEAGDIGLAIATDLKDYLAGRIGWGDVDRGLLLEGAPGVGKTTFAKAFAKSAGLRLFSGSAAQWQAAGHLGDMLKAMRRCFAEAREAAPCVLFIDELDSFGSRANFAAQHRDYSTQVVNALLECLDGVADRKGVFVVGATNDASRIDPAILRAGRLDRLVKIPLPDLLALKGILRFHLRDDLEGADLTLAAAAARGATGADCEAWVRRARGVARRAKRPICIEDLSRAIAAGAGELPPATRRLTALHEAGHVIVGLALGQQPNYVSISRRGGVTSFVGENSDSTAEEILALIARKLGGRAAERLVNGTVTAGSGGPSDSDLAAATSIAMAYHASWGFGDLGEIWLGDPEVRPDMVLLMHLRSSISRTLTHAAEEAHRALEVNRGPLQRLASALEHESYVDAMRMREIVGEVATIEIRPLPEIAVV